MPRPSAEKLALNADIPIRLACRNCFREDGDGIAEIPGDWENVTEYQSLAESMTTYDGDEDGEPPEGFSILDWYTHLGVCPDCQD